MHAGLKEAPSPQRCGKGAERAHGHGLLGQALCAGLADHDDMDLAGVLHLVLDLLGDVVGEDGCLGVVDLVRLDHDADLAACLHGEGLLDAVMGIGDGLELLQALDVVLIALAAGAGAGGRRLQPG